MNNQDPVPRIEMRRVSKTFTGVGQDFVALQDVSLQVMPGEFVTIIGPSGSGKSTLFNLCVGLLEADSGEILIDGLQTRDRTGKVGYMPQRDLLLPWRNILENVMVPLEIQGVPRREARLKAREMLSRFELENFAREYPSALSGGMRQRVALLRTWLMGRNILLLDEPFGALDALTRKDLQNWLLRACQEFQQTVLFITHDVEEAVYLADRVIVLSARPGRIKHELRIDLPRPRDLKMITDPAFSRLERELLVELGLAV